MSQRISESSFSADEVEDWAPGASRTIVVIEDEGDIGDIIRFVLTRAGFEVRVARTGAEGLDAVRRGADMILLDLNLPDMDGLEVCRHLRDQADLSNTPILIVSARSADVDRTLSLAAGASDYLVKPFALKELVARCHYGIFRPRSSRK